MKNGFMNATDTVCGWTKGPTRCRPPCTEEVNKVVNEKNRLWKEWRKGGNTDGYQEVKVRLKYVTHTEKKEVSYRSLQMGRATVKKKNHEVFKIAKHYDKNKPGY